MTNSPSPEIIATCNLLLIAGHETTVNLIANAVLALLRHPDQWRALGADPGRAAAVIEETLRFDPPVQLVGRIAGADMVIGSEGGVGIEVPKGDTMMLLLAAAHRDPAVTERPDEFDPTGPPSAIWRSGTDRTSASVRCWRGWRRRWHSPPPRRVPRRSPRWGTGL